MRKRGKQFAARRNPNALWLAVAGVKPLGEGHQIDLGLSYHVAFESMRKGQGQKGDFHTIACAINIALVLSERGYGSGLIDRVKDAQNGLLRCMERGERTRAWGLDGEAMSAIADALALHDDQIAAATQREIREAIAEVHRRVDNGDTMRASSP